MVNEIRITCYLCIGLFLSVLRNFLIITLIVAASATFRTIKRTFLFLSVSMDNLPSHSNEICHAVGLLRHMMSRVICCSFETFCPKHLYGYEWKQQLLLKVFLVHKQFQR